MPTAKEIAHWEATDHAMANLDSPDAWAQYLLSAHATPKGALQEARKNIVEDDPEHTAFWGDVATLIRLEGVSDERAE